ncbi:MAG: zinc-dependent metalloprotease [Acidimicrobiales bacterium]
MPVDWELAQRTAARVSGEEPYSQSYLASTLESDFEEFTAQAEELVTQYTGLTPLKGRARARVIGRSEWVAVNTRAFERLLGPLFEKLGSDGSFTRRVTGLQLGTVLGWMSRRVLGQYDLLVVEDENPEDQDIVYYVGPNVLALEKRHDFPPREFRLWLAVHEVTHRAQFTGVPWMRDHFLSLVKQTVDSLDPDPERMMRALRRIRASRSDGSNVLEDGGLASLFATDEQRQVMDQIAGLMSLLEGHGDTTMNRVSEDFIPAGERFHRVLHERRTNPNTTARIFQKLIGMEAKMAQYIQGEAFIEFVEEAGGKRVLDHAWAAAENLPSMDEIREPQLWIERVVEPAQLLSS